MDSKQLYEKQSNQFNPFFPIVRLEDIIDKISDKSIQWILNNYNHIYVEYSESREITRNKVPQILRRNGLWISYNNGKKNITEYYIGENTDVNNYIEWTLYDNWKEFDELTIQDKSITYQHLSDALRQLLAGGNTITNFPDEEDITSSGGVLSFKDRDYEPNNFSGLGKVILRKNITVDKDGNVKNTLTQGMINKENTIYEIRYDFDLNGKEIVVPEGCVLDFQGGSLSNGTIIGNNSKIHSINNSIFYSIKFKGNYQLSYINSLWFSDYLINDMFASISILSKSNIKTYINIDRIEVNDVVMDDRYDVNTPVYALYIPSSHSVTEFNNSVISVNTTNQGFARIIWIQEVEDVTIQNLDMVGDVENNSTQSQYAHGIYMQSSSHINVLNCNVSKMCGDGISVVFVNDLIVDNVDFDYNGRNNISIISGYDILFSNCKSTNAGTINGKLPKAGLDIEPNNVEQRELLNNIKFNNCDFKNNADCCISYLTDGTIRTNYPEVELTPLAKDTVVFENCAFDIFKGSANWGSGYTIKNSVCNNRLNTKAYNSKIINSIIPNIVTNDAEMDFQSINNHTINSGFHYEDYIPFDVLYAGRVFALTLLVPKNLSACHLVIDIEGMPGQNHYIKNEMHYYLNYDRSFIKTLDDVKDANPPRTALQGSGAYSYVVGSLTSVNTVEGSAELKTLYFKNINGDRPLGGILHIKASSILRNNITLYRTQVVKYDELSDVDFKLNLSSDVLTLDYPTDLSVLVEPNVVLYKGLSVYVNNEKVTYNGTRWDSFDKAEYNIKRYGAYSDLPPSSKIYGGFKYFCTNRATVEGDSHGIELTFVANKDGKDVWVDALGRVVE